MCKMIILLKWYPNSFFLKILQVQTKHNSSTDTTEYKVSYYFDWIIVLAVQFSNKSPQQGSFQQLTFRGTMAFFHISDPKYQSGKHPNRFISTGKRLNNSASHYRNNKSITIFCGGTNNTITETTKTSQSFLGGLDAHCCFNYTYHQQVGPSQNPPHEQTLLVVGKVKQ